MPVSSLIDLGNAMHLKTILTFTCGSYLGFPIQHVYVLVTNNEMNFSPVELSHRSFSMYDDI